MAERGSGAGVPTRRGRGLAQRDSIGEARYQRAAKERAKRKWKKKEREKRAEEQAAREQVEEQLHRSSRFRRFRFQLPIKLELA